MSAACLKESSYLEKNSDDTALLSLFQGSEPEHGSTQPNFINLYVVEKKKKTVINFRTVVNPWQV